MSTFLDTLRIKKPPTTFESAQFIAKVHMPVTVKTSIKDVIKDSKFDRKKFLQNIRPYTAIKSKEESLFIPEPDTKLTAITTVSTTPVAKLVTTPVTKTKRRIRLVTKEQPSIKQKERIKAPVVKDIPYTQLKIGTEDIVKRLPKPEKQILIKASSYYMNNREIFINFMSSLFEPYKQELIEATKEGVTCDSNPEKSFSIATHQKIVRDYIASYTPYRGLLLYHGLGSGKTCSSISIAEGMKNTKRIVVMSPASLQKNYYEELKKCGDFLYRKNQYWEFIPATSETIPILSSVLSISPSFIKAAKGAWLVDLRKKTNFYSLNSQEKTSLERQLDEMIRYKYTFIAYNGLTSQRFKKLTQDGRINPFDNTVVIIDEAHNLVSRIVNKLNKEESISMRLYNYLLSAENAKIIMLSGTPIINYPNELGIMYNILRGYIKTWKLRLNINNDRKVNKDFFISLFKSTSLGGNILDYIDYNSSSTTLTITRNPFGFVNKTTKGIYNGVRIGERGNMNDDDFISNITRLLSSKRIKVIPRATQVILNTALPDTLDSFQHYFIDPKTAEIRNINMFKRRIFGLTSYFRSASESLLPRFDKSKNFHIVRIPMSDFQFGVYEEARAEERKRDRKNQRKKAKKDKTKELYEDIVSTYRIYSRAFCNFVFPKPYIIRPLPSGSKNINENELADTAKYDLIEATEQSVRIDDPDGRYDADDIQQALSDNTSQDITEDYGKRIQTALQQLDANKQVYLTPEALQTYGPKLLAILNNIEDPEHKGLHLVYSQFRTLEGIGVFKLVLEANGFAQFKIKYVGGTWSLDIKSEDKGKQMFALYTGTESVEEKEIIRNVFNGAWKNIPTSLEEELTTIASNNNYGEIIRVLMITASGAEGINLFNVRYVHIMEPYWHPARIEQIIGRARRICSHQNLPEEHRTVDAYLYLMTLSDKQMRSDEALELRVKDKSKIDNITPITTDQALFELANMKLEVSEQLLLAIKESSIDCDIHLRPDAKEKLHCFSFGPVSSDKYAYTPNIAAEDSDAVTGLHKKVVEWTGVELMLDGIKYALNRDTGRVYDYESYIRGQPIQIGTLIEDTGPTGKKVYRLEKI